LGEGFTVVVNRSTVPVGSGNYVEALVRRAFQEAHGGEPDGRLAVASNPEFLREGQALYDSLYPDRIVVGAEDRRAIEVLRELYEPILEQSFAPPPFLPRPERMGAVPFLTTDLASAELIKYGANAFLALKISFINELARLAEKVGADIQEVARGIGLDHRIGPRFLQAGLGWGGSCFPKDTAALLAMGREYGLSLGITEAARKVNEDQRRWAVDKLLAELRGCRKSPPQAVTRPWPAASPTIVACPDRPRPRLPQGSPHSPWQDAGSAPAKQRSFPPPTS
jgi:UDPglucose 6-dehydrogenase